MEIVSITNDVRNCICELEANLGKPPSQLTTILALRILTNLNSHSESLSQFLQTNMESLSPDLILGVQMLLNKITHIRALAEPAILAPVVKGIAEIQKMMAQP